MTFSLTNALDTFQRTPGILLGDFNWCTFLVYLDDVTVFSESFDTDLPDTDMVPSTLRKAGVTPILRKCCFFTDKVKYLGHTICSSKLTIEKNTIKKR